MRSRFLIQFQLTLAHPPLNDLRKGIKPEYDNLNNLLSECFRVCELIGKEGSYYLLCLSVRNRDNPREIIQIELYLEVHDKYSIDLVSLFNLLNRQAEEARVLIEGYHGFWVYLPDLSGLLKTTGITFDEIVGGLPLVPKWWLSSIQHAVNYRQEKEKNEKEKKDKEGNGEEWVKLYIKGDAEKAESYLIQEIGRTEKRNKRAKMYNDLGYIRCHRKIRSLDLARKDLETAMDLHFAHLQLTLLNLSYLDIENDSYEKAIEKMEIALLLSLSPIEIDAGYLRLCVPEYKLGFLDRWEQHPANVIEASYINLAYALLRIKKSQEADDMLQEGLELLPNSIRLKHALARFYLYNKKANLAFPIYKELADISSLPDKGIEREIRYFDSFISRRQGKRKKRRGK